MKRVRLTVAYDGTNYCGWQIQPNGITIEEVLHKTISKALQEDVQLIGASRTDSGVHARGNVVVFDTETSIPTERIAPLLNQRLPEDIVICKSEEVAKDFHPRYGNIEKTYVYRVLLSELAFPLKRKTHWQVSYKIDVPAMEKAATYLVGTHDFKSFCNVKTSVESTVRTITKLSITEKEEGELIFEIVGNGFLYHMVRIIVGTLIRVGRGYYSPEKVKEIVEAKERKAAGATAPAHGLELIEIRYED